MNVIIILNFYFALIFWHGEKPQFKVKNKYNGGEKQKYILKINYFNLCSTKYIMFYVKIFYFFDLVRVVKSASWKKVIF